MRHTGDSIRMNFAGPFLFNLRLLLHRQLLEERQLIRQENAPQPALFSLVRSYLLHAGYCNTLNSLDRALKERQVKSVAASPGRRDPSLSGSAEGCENENSVRVEQAPHSGELFEADSDDIICVTAASQTQDEDEGLASENREDQEATLVSWPQQVPKRLLQSLATRAAIRQAIMEGRILNAIELLELHYPSVLTSSNAS